MSGLYEIAGQLAGINNQIEEAGGELTPDLEETLDQIEMEMENKTFSIAQWVLNIGGDEAALDLEIQRLQKRKKAKENLKERLKLYIKENMIRADRRKFSFPTFEVRIQENGGKAPVEITDPKKVPARFIDIIPATTEINTDKIREAAAKEDVSEFAKVERGHHLRIQ